MVNENKVGVKVISGLYYLLALVLLGVGIGFVIFPDSLLGSLGDIGFDLNAESMLIGGIFILLTSVFFLFIGRGLWKGQGWSRKVVVILAALSILNSVIILFTVSGMVLSSILNILIMGFIIWYLGFDKGVRGIFNK